MQKQIHDQLEESNANKHLRSTAFEMALFGTGVMKGPFAIDKEYPNWDDEGKYDPVIKTVPKVEHVSVWDFYPDPDSTNMDQAQYVIQRHKMSRSELRGLKKRPYFREEVIEQAIAEGDVDAQIEAQRTISQMTMEEARLKNIQQQNEKIQAARPAARPAENISQLSLIHI